MKKLLIVLTLVPMVVFAGALNKKNKQSKGQGDSDLGELIKTCVFFEANPQIKDFNAEVVCRGYKTRWDLQATYEDKEVLLTNKFEVESDIAMKDKRYEVDTKSYNLPVDNSVATCSVYEEVKETLLTQTVTLETCQDLKDLLEEGRDSFCRKYLESAPVDTEEKTGEVKSTCK